MADPRRVQTPADDYELYDLLRGLALRWPADRRLEVDVSGGMHLVDADGERIVFGGPPPKVRWMSGPFGGSAAYSAREIVDVEGHEADLRKIIALCEAGPRNTLFAGKYLKGRSRRAHGFAFAVIQGEAVRMLAELTDDEAYETKLASMCFSDEIDDGTEVRKHCGNDPTAGAHEADQHETAGAAGTPPTDESTPVAGSSGGDDARGWGTLPRREVPR